MVVKKFRWKLGGLTVLKTFIISFLTPLGMIEWILDLDLFLTIYVAMASALVSAGLMFGQVLDRYLRTQGFEQ